MNNYGYTWRIIIIIFSMLYPFLCLLLAGYSKSLSSYWSTPVEPIFIIANLLVSYYFFETKNWKIPAVLLMLVTAFNNILYPDIHNIFAVCFFLASFISLFNSKRYIVIKLLYLAGAIIMTMDLLVGEIICIISIGLYHTFKLNKLNKLITMKKSAVISNTKDKIDSNKMESFTCTICDESIFGIANDPEPVKLEGKCCTSCLFKIVIPKAIKNIGIKR